MHAEPPAVLPNTSEVTTEATPQTQPIERRRPGRVAYANPHLIALLRRHPPADPVEKSDAKADANAQRPAYDLSRAAFADRPEQEGERGRLAAPRGIGIGVLLAVPLWASIVALGWCGMVADRQLTQDSPSPGEQQGEVANQSQEDRHSPSRPKGVGSTPKGGAAPEAVASEPIGRSEHGPCWR
jgi:hypothetical protein